MIARLLAATTVASSLVVAAGSNTPAGARASADPPAATAQSRAASASEDSSSAAAAKPTAPTPPALDGPTNVPPLAAVAQVYAAIEAQVAAWNRGDLGGFCALYADDALFVSPAGLTRGRRAVYERYEKRYGTDRSGMGTLAIEPLEARAFPADETAGAVSVAARWTLEWPKKDPASGHTLIVFRKKPGGGWELVQDASM